MKILVINGPNLNLIGTREPEVYGKKTYDDLIKYIKLHCDTNDISVEFFQSNSEGDIIDKLHSAKFTCPSISLNPTADSVDGIILNAGAYTHYSYAIHDAIRAIEIPTIEVHISNIHKREAFRHESVICAACVGQVSGLGFYSYIAAIDFLRNGDNI